MLTGNIIWATIRWGTQPLVIPFEDQLIEFRLGVSFWLVLGGGMLIFCKSLELFQASSIQIKNKSL